MYGTESTPPVVLPNGDWSLDTPTYEPQRFIYDTNECSQLGGFITPLEIYLNWLERTGKMPQKFVDFGNKNGYKDSNKSWSISERFTAILDGTSILGNTVQNAWLCFQKYGAIPRSMLNWGLTDAAQFPNQALMDTSYYNPAVITQDMIDMGKQFMSFIAEIGWGWFGGVGSGSTAIPEADLARGLQTSPLGIVVSVPTPVSLWNQEKIPYTGGTTLDHAVTLYKVDEVQPFPKFIADQYEPFLKQFSANYPIWVAIAFFIVLA